MGRYKLIAVGEHAKQLKMCDDGPDLLLWTDKPILLGRGVKEGDGYKYPNHWNSLSSKHCNLVFQATAGEEGQWLVTDSSTNGTFINGVKIGKGNSAVLKAGDKLGMSTVAPAAQQVANAVNTVEYQLQYEPDATSPHAPVASHGSHVAPVQPNKRKQEGSVSPNAAGQTRFTDGSAFKRMRSEEAEVPELVQLRKSNQELRGKAEAQLHEIEKLEARLHEVEGQHSKQLQEVEEKHHADLSAAERAAAETLEAERTRSTQLQQQLAELTASSAEQQRALQAQLTEANQLLAAKSDQVTRLGVQLQQAQEGLASRDADIAQLKSELSQEQQAVTELKLKLTQYETSAAALQDAQKQLQAKAEALSSVQQQLREEQRGRAAAEAAVRQAERTLERTKAALLDKVDSEKENMLVYDRSVQEVRNSMEERLSAKQAELERQQQQQRQDLAQMREMFSLMFDKLSGGLNQQTGVFSGMFQDVEEGLAQISAARKDAGLAAGGQNGAEPDVDMEGGQDAEEHVGDHLQLNDTPMTQALGAPSGASGGGDPTPHQSQIGGYGGEGSTPVATQDATAGTAAAAAAAAAALPATLQPGVNGTEAADFAGQTQEVFPATMAFPVFGTAAVAGPTPALAAVCTPAAPGSNLGCLNPGVLGSVPVQNLAIGRSSAVAFLATAPPAGRTAPTGEWGTAVTAHEAAGMATEGRGCAETQALDGDAAAMQQQFEAQMDAAGQEKGEEDGMAMEQQDEGMVQGSPDSAAPEQQQQQGDAANQEVAETQEETQQDADHDQQQQQQQHREEGEVDPQQQQRQQGDEDMHGVEDLLAAEEEQRGTTPSPLRRRQQQQLQHEQQGDGGEQEEVCQQEQRSGLVASQGDGQQVDGDTTAAAAAAAAGPAVVQGTEDVSEIITEGAAGVPGEAGALTPAAAAAAGEGTAPAAAAVGAGEEEEEELGVTDDGHGSSRSAQQQEQQQQSQLSASQQQHEQQQQQQQQEEEAEGQGEEGMRWMEGVHNRSSTYPQKQVPKSLLGSSGSPSVRPHSQPMSAIDLNKQQLPVNQQQPGHDPYDFTD